MWSFCSVRGVQYDASVKSVIKITTVRREQGLSADIISGNEFKNKNSTYQNIKLNYRNGNWDYFTGLGYSNYKTEYTLRNTIEFTGISKNHIEQNLTYNSFLKGYDGNVGVNYSNNSKISSGVKFNFSHNPQIDGILKGDASHRINEMSGIPEELDISSPGTKSTSHLNFYYHHAINNDCKFQFDGDYLRGNHTVCSTSKTESNADVISESNANYNLYAGKMQMLHNIFTGSLRYGVDISFTDNQQTYDMHGFKNTSASNENEDLLKQFLGALFATYSFKSKNFSFEFGGRYEHIDFKYYNLGRLQEEQSKKFDNLFPFCRITYDADNGTSVSVSYVNSIVRPTYSQLSSSVMYVDGYTFQSGNPLLKPAYENKLTSLFSWKDIIAEVSYSRYDKPILNISKLYNNRSAVLFTLENFSSYDELFVNIVYSPTFGIWRPAFEAGVFKPFLKYEGQTYNKPYFTYEWNNLIKLSKNFLFSFNLWGTSDGNSHMTYFSPLFRSDTGLNAVFFNNKLNVMLGYSDIFHTDREWWSKYINGILIDKQGKRDTRGLSIRINYTLNPARSKYKGVGAGTSEINRL